MCRGLRVYSIQINSIATQALPVLPPPIVCICINQFHFYCKYECEFLHNQKIFFSTFNKKKAMQVIVFGATGSVGKQLVKQALYKGYKVKAFGRNVFTADLPKDDNLELVQGALFDEKEVYNAIKGCDVVLSALGGAADGTDVTRSLGIKNIIKQMQKANVKRIIAVGGMGILNAADDTLLIDAPDYPPQYIPVGREHLKAYEALKTSGLDWTFVCCPDLIDAEATGEFITNADYPPNPNKYQINTGNVALFMLNEAVKNEYVQHRVGISN